MANVKDMPNEIMHCGHRFVLRPDGLYESVERFEMSDDAWSADPDSAGCSMIFRITGPDSMMPWLLCNDRDYVQTYIKICNSTENCTGLSALDYPTRGKNGEVYIDLF